MDHLDEVVDNLVNKVRLMKTNRQVVPPTTQECRDLLADALIAEDEDIMHTISDEVPITNED